MDNVVLVESLPAVLTFKEDLKSCITSFYLVAGGDGRIEYFSDSSMVVFDGVPFTGEYRLESFIGGLNSSMVTAAGRECVLAEPVCGKMYRVTKSVKGGKSLLYFSEVPSSEPAKSVAAEEKSPIQQQLEAVNSDVPHAGSDGAADEIKRILDGLGIPCIVSDEDGLVKFKSSGFESAGDRVDGLSGSVGKAVLGGKSFRYAKSGSSWFMVADYDVEIERMIDSVRAELNGVVAEKDNLAESLKGELNDVKVRLSACEDRERQINDTRSAIVLSVKDKLTRLSGIAAAIEDISVKIHVISINAAIESARHGEAGKGFSVIAREIRKLSEDTKVYTKKIIGEIDDLVVIS